MKKFVLLLIATLITLSGFCAYLRNVPVELKQPDGRIINCFVTGDEFHRRLHDKDNYTIIQNPESGFYVYAMLRGDELLPTSFIFGSVDPKTISIRPGYDISEKQAEEKRQTFLKSAQKDFENSTKGNFNNIVISIRFSDQAPTNLVLQDYEVRFNSETELSLKSYYKEVSNSQLNITTYFFPSPQNQTILEYQDTYPRNFYSPYHAENNSEGYQPNEWIEREQTLFKNAIQYVSSQISQSGVNFDMNNDGFIDNIVFVFQGFADNWGNVLWPMTSSLTSSGITVGSKLAGIFNKQLSAMLNPDVLSHEFFHSLGAPDLYRYTNTNIEPVGAWDIMGNTGLQHMTTYMKWKYGKWSENITEIIHPGTYTLRPVSQSPFASYRIASPFSISEFFIVEYRKKDGSFESNLPGNYNDGLIIYRINTNAVGNAFGPPDEMYVYRPSGDSLQNGYLGNATFSANVNRTVFNNETNPSCFLSNGSSGWIDISNVTTAENEISFTVNEVNYLPKPRNFHATENNGKVLFTWNSPVNKGFDLLGYNIFLEGNNVPLNSLTEKDSTYISEIPGHEVLYTFKLTARYQQGESAPVSFSYYNTSDPALLDSLALVAIYNQCDGPNWLNHENWLTGRLNSWFGVTIDQNRVIRLNLTDSQNRNFGLKNSIPREIGYLTGLESLSFNFNSLIGSIPKEIGKLVNLKTLQVIGNHLSGELPIELFNLNKLEFLYLASNNLSGELLEEIRNFNEIQHLDLTQNQFSGNLPNGLFTLKNLLSIGLNINKLTGEIPNEIGNLTNLTSLQLAGNYFTGTIPEGIWLLTELVNLNLTNSIDGVGLSGEISSKLMNLKNLEGLSLNDNNFTGPIFEYLCELPKLRSFWIQNNKFTGQIPPKFGSLANLQDMIISDNQFSGKLPPEFGNLSGMNCNLILSNNQFTGAIPKGIANFTEVIAFGFDNNQFDAIPLMKHSPNLWGLSLSKNRFTFEDIEPLVDIKFAPGCHGLTYQNQAKIGKAETKKAPINMPFTLSVYCGGKNNRYQWFKNGQAVSEIQTSPDLLINQIFAGDNGEYICRITNTIVPFLTIESYPIILMGVNTLFAAAGSDFGVDEGTLVSLDGSGSYNPNGNSIIYKWTAPDGITLNAYNVASPTFTAPEVDYDTPYTFSLVVNNGIGDSAADEIVVTVRNLTAPNQTPIANAGPGQSVLVSPLDFASMDEKTALGIPIETKIQVLKRSLTGQILAYKTIISDHDIVQTIVELDGSLSSDPDENPLTYKWTAPAGITLSSTTAINPTFIAPEVTKDTTYTFYLIVNDGIGDSNPDSVNILIKNIYIPQTVMLNPGWNIMSLHVMPKDPNLKNILQPSIDDGKLKKVMDESGKVIEDWGTFGGWQNTIVDAKNTEGYKINVTSPTIVEVTGIPTQLPFDISLNTGWNIISWPSPIEQDGMAVFQPLIDAGKLKKVMNESGKVIENWGIYGGWQNAIGNLQPGEGYAVNVTSDCILTIKENVTEIKSEEILSELIASTHFIPAYKGNGTDHMNINLINLAESGITEGDEIGIFDGNVCVGSTQIPNFQSSFINRNSISISVSANDGTEVKNGYSDGNPISVKLFRNGKEYPVLLESLNKSKTVFEKGESLFAMIEFGTGLNGTQTNDLTNINCYPNPFSNEVTVDINLKTDAQVEVEVLNQLGQMVKYLTTKQLLSVGLQKLTWNGRNEHNQKVSPGIYHLKVNIDGAIIHKKIVYSK